MLHLSLAKVENSFPFLMERHSHFQSEADERERGGVPLGENGLCIAGLKGLQRWLVTPSRWEMSWDGLLLVFLTLACKPTEFIVQVFAQAVTVNKTAKEGDRFTCVESQGSWFTGMLGKLMFDFKVILKYTITFCQIYSSSNVWV